MTEQKNDYDVFINGDISGDLSLAGRDIKTVYNFYNNFGLEDQGFFLLSPRFFREIPAPSETDTRFYDGARPSWFDILNDRDIQREVTVQILNQIQANVSIQPAIIPIIGSGGSGKSSILMRIAFSLAMDGNIVLYHRRESLQVSSAVVRQFVTALSGARIIVVIDDGGRVSNLSSFLTSCAEQNLPITFVVGSRPLEWSPLKNPVIGSIDLISPDSNPVWNVDELTDGEIWQVILRLAQLKIIRKPNPERKDEIIEHYAKQSKRSAIILVTTLLKGDGLEKIVRDELIRLQQADVELFNAYRFICLFTAMRSFATRELIAKLINNPSLVFDLVSRFPGMLEINGDIVTARHDKIAEIVIQGLYQNDGEGLYLLATECIKAASALDDPKIINEIYPNLELSTERHASIFIELVNIHYCRGNLKRVLEILEEMVWPYDSNEIAKNVIPTITQQLVNLIAGSTDYVLVMQELDSDGNVLTEGITLPVPDCVATLQRVPPEELDRVLEDCDFLYQRVGEYLDSYNLAVLFGTAFYEALAIAYPDNYLIPFHRGKFLHWINFAPERDVIVAFQKALQLKPDLAVAHAAICNHAYLDDDHDLALRSFNMAFEMDRTVLVEDSELHLVDGITAFLQMKGQIGEWLIIKALRYAETMSEQINFAEVVRKFESIDKLDLHIDNDNELYEILEKDDFQFTPGTYEENMEKIERVAKLGEELRSQPLETRREVASQFWEHLPPNQYNLPTD